MKSTAVIALLAVAALTAACGKNDDNVATESTTTLDTVTTTTLVSSTTATTAAAAASTSTSSTAAKPTTTQKPTTVKVTNADNGKKQTIHVGSSINLRLETCGGCGTEWRITTAPDAKVLKQTGSKVDSTTTSTKPGDGPMTGTPVWYVFDFKGVAAGSTTVVAKLYGPGDDAPSETFTMRVEVLP